ncbi:hypothetical protein L596_012102 [Steinernema carpocapsae]|uniref:TROVE domain-containing protein n=1 Tax=Steinernema carpocapsae TaxID=34508 RepID=A0A4U5NWP3_STECR|nr:hypothetical protein L596_012102 [Steinernema carpocapsae]
MDVRRSSVLVAGAFKVELCLATLKGTHKKLVRIHGDIDCSIVCPHLGMSVEDTPMEVDVAEVDEVADDTGKPMELVSLQNELNNIVQKLNGLYKTSGQMVQIRADQVQNNAGGFVFQVSDETRVRRFLILGTSGGTYYQSEKELTLENIEALKTIIQNGKGGMLISEIVKISVGGRAPRQDPALFALALCAQFNIKREGEWNEQERDDYKKYVEALRTNALHVMPRVCRIPTHLFKFVSYSEMIARQLTDGTGWGRGMRNAVSRWYTNKDPEQLVYHVTKYQKREGWSHRDLLRLSHPKTKKLPEAKQEEFSNIFKYIVSGKRRWQGEDNKAATSMTERYEYLNCIAELKDLGELKPEQIHEDQTKRVVHLISERNLAREVIPSGFLNSKEVWAAMLPKMPMTALIRNLGKISGLKMTLEANPEDAKEEEKLSDEALEENAKTVKMIVEKLKNKMSLKKAKVHPIQILFALTTYKEGGGYRSKNTWPVNDEIVQALDEAFLLAFDNVTPTKKRICVALDVSGSMCSPITNSNLSCREASVAMSSIFLRTEENVECMAFSTTFIELPFMTKKATIDEMTKATSKIDFGSTDCAQPMLWATQKKKPFDAFIVFTDNDTWHGEVHPFEAIKEYRESMGIEDARLIVCGMTSTDFTIADPTDPGMLDVVGFDTAVPNIISDFLTGQL